MSSCILLIITIKYYTQTGVFSALKRIVFKDCLYTSTALYYSNHFTFFPFIQELSMKKSSRLEIDFDDTNSMTNLMHENNHGARQVVEQLLDQEDGLDYLKTLDDMNIRGEQLWVGYKRFAHEDLDRFMAAIKARDPIMVKLINAWEAMYDDMATTEGAQSGARYWLDLDNLLAVEDVFEEWDAREAQKRS
jgi:hypothetical protein